MIQHTTTNGLGILGNAGTIQMTAEVADRVLCPSVPRRFEAVVLRDELSEVSGKRLSKPSPDKWRGFSSQCQELETTDVLQHDRWHHSRCLQSAELPAAAWATMVMNGNVAIDRVDSSSY